MQTLSLLGPEALLLSLSLLIAITYPELGASWLRKTEGILSAIARRRKTSVLFCGFLAFALRAAILPFRPIPAPAINNEFGFLLLADTLLHGRVANPPHPMGLHFESLHIIVRPTYASMWPPMQGIFLAVGKLIAGCYFFGVMLSVAVMCAAICWMLQGWLPPGWALFGGLMPVALFGVFSYWDDGYMGGAPAALGGALLLGALPRMMRKQRARDALLMGVGLAILANSRPYEGFVLGLTVAGALLAWMVRGKNRPPVRILVRRVMLPLGLVLIAAAVATGYYFWRITGSPFVMPYQVNRATYAVARYFIWQKPNPVPVYHNQAMRDFYLKIELPIFRRVHTISGFAWHIATMLLGSWIFYVAPILTIGVLALPRVVRDRRIRFLLLAGVVSLAATAVTVFFQLHYIAPITGIILAVILQGLRHVRTWRWEGRPTGAFLVRSVAAMCVLMIPIELHFAPLNSHYDAIRAQGEQRAKLLAQLRSMPGRQLVFVRYSAHHDPMDEWVYNGAEIDSSKVVWARDMGAARNSELIRFFKDPCVWMVEPDKPRPALSRYPERGEGEGTIPFLADHPGKDGQ